MHPCALCFLIDAVATAAAFRGLDDLPFSARLEVPSLFTLILNDSPRVRKCTPLPGTTNKRNRLLAPHCKDLISISFKKHTRTHPRQERANFKLLAYALSG
ncbi:hypothetical protein BC826DRAFT_744435 [Russula brevipes]|nr:hypothetical protein BC826DRAFT_744435 [Russula brevipes]